MTTLGKLYRYIPDGSTRLVFSGLEFTAKVLCRLKTNDIILLLKKQTMAVHDELSYDHYYAVCPDGSVGWINFEEDEWEIVS